MFARNGDELKSAPWPELRSAARVQWLARRRATMTLKVKATVNVELNQAVLPRFARGGRERPRAGAGRPQALVPAILRELPRGDKAQGEPVAPEADRHPREAGRDRHLEARARPGGNRPDATEGGKQPSS